MRTALRLLRLLIHMVVCKKSQVGIYIPFYHVPAWFKSSKHIAHFGQSDYDNKISADDYDNKISCPKHRRANITSLYGKFICK